ncbi:MAG: tetratricopeptide repeat protein [Candidatus Firestonebacteria bacterium]|nr:tetratricopeptide repeat protein [Candidatus Firestonebacteria bacterium]
MLRRRCFNIRVLFAAFLALSATVLKPLPAAAEDAGERAALQSLIETYRKPAGNLPLAGQMENFKSRFPQSVYLPQLKFLSGELRLQAGEFAQARQIYEQMIAQYPENAYAESAAYRRGECLFNEGKHGEALKAWEALLPRASRLMRPEIMLGLTQCRLKQGAWEQAATQLETLLQSYPAYRNLSDVRQALGVLAFIRREYAQTAEHLEGVESPEAFYYLGRALHQQNKPYPAAEYFNRLILQYPTAKEYVKVSVFEKAEVLYDLHRYAGAEAAYRYFLSVYPVDPLVPYAQYKLSCLEMLGTHPEAALKRLEPLTRVNLGSTGNLFVTYLRAETLVRLGQKNEAFALYQQLWNGGKESILTSDVLFKKGWLQLELGSFKKAQEDLGLYTRTFTTSPLLPHVYFLLGNAFFLQNATQQAIQVYHDTILNFPYSKITDACLFQIQRGYQQLEAPDKLIASTAYILQVLEGNFPPESGALRALGYYTLGEAYYQVRQYDSANKNYLYILKNFGDTSVSHLARESLAWSYFQDGKYAEAEKIALTLLSLPGVDKEVVKRIRLLRVHCLFNLKKFAPAVTEYAAWIKTYPQDDQIPEALYGLSQTYLRVGQREKSLEIMQKIVKQFRQNPLAKRALLAIGHTYFKDGGYSEALQTYHLYLKNWPHDPQVQEIELRIAQTLYNAGKIDQARDNFLHYLKAYPDGAYANEARTGVELADWRDTDTVRSLEKYRNFLRLHPASEFADLAQYRLGLIYYERQAWEDCIRELRALNYNYPGSSFLPNAQYYMGICFEKQNQTTEAVKTYEQFVQNFSNHDLMPEVLSRLGEVHFRSGEYLEAVKAYRLILDKFPLPEYEANALYNISVCYEQNKMWTDAIGSYLQYYAKFPTGARAVLVILHIGITYHQMQKYQQAAEYLEKALPQTATVDVPEVLYRLGESYERLGTVEKAVALYQRALGQKPANNDYRLMAVSQLGALYEKQNKSAEAIAAYRDISKNSRNAEWRQLAVKRIRALEGR